MLVLSFSNEKRSFLVSRSRETEWRGRQKLSGDVMRPLVPGDTIAVVSPASATGTDVLDGFAALAEARGYRAKIFGGGDEKFGRMAADDHRRAEHLLDAFRDDKIAAIVAARGGYGSGRLLAHLDGQSLRPKILVGYSDITNLLLHVAAQSGFTTFHGPMAVDLARKHDKDSIDWFFSLLEGKLLSYTLNSPDFIHFRSGTVSGPLYGGNISVIGALAGTRSLAVPDGAILMLEDVNEFMYSLDRSLVHLRRAGVLDRASAILFADMKLKDGMSPDNSLGMLFEDVLHNHFHDFPGPIAFGLPCGHTDRQLTLPIGCETTVEVTQSAVRLTFRDLWEKRLQRRAAA
jgi:muramoyltetrapeptide carboxypeptidase